MMSRLAAAPVSAQTPVLPLRDGDRLDRAEFWRRYEAMPDVNKAELIEGVVYMPSPVRMEHHGSPHFHFCTWLGTYEAYTPGVIGGDNPTVRLDDNNVVQPDGMLMIQHGGQAHVSDDDYVDGGPEAIGEISASSASIDLNKKLQAYRRAKVREYIVWRVEDRAVDWFVLRQDKFERLPRDAAGIYKSEVFPGLWLDADALVAGNLPRVLDVLQQGIACPEHAALLARLQHP